MPEQELPDEALQEFVAPLVSQCTEFYEWPAARFEVNTYLHDELPPLPCITSVRAVVLRRPDEAIQEVLVVQDPDGLHILPGGRREAGESLVDTAIREVLEETGWQVTVGRVLGFKHFFRLTPALPAFRHQAPHFAQLVYVAEAQTYLPEAQEQDGYEIGAAFVAVEEVEQHRITEGEQHFLRAGLEQRQG